MSCPPPRGYRIRYQLLVGITGPEEISKDARTPPRKRRIHPGRNVARKKVAHRLAPLPRKTILRAREHKTARLAEILRGIAVTSQTDEPQVFYPVRDVAQ